MGHPTAGHLMRGNSASPLDSSIRGVNKIPLGGKMSRNEKSTGGNRSEDTLLNAARDKRQLEETS